MKLARGLSECVNNNYPGKVVNGVPAQTGFLRTLTKTIYISAIFTTLNPILSVANLSRLECAETPFAREPRLYEYISNFTSLATIESSP